MLVQSRYEHDRSGGSNPSPTASLNLLAKLGLSRQVHYGCTKSTLHPFCFVPDKSPGPESGVCQRKTLRAHYPRIGLGGAILRSACSSCHPFEEDTPGPALNPFGNLQAAGLLIPGAASSLRRRR